eukprot:scaffold1137_cov392-Pavlova_lutheri.AAC.15
MKIVEAWDASVNNACPLQSESTSKRFHLNTVSLVNLCSLQIRASVVITREKATWSSTKRQTRASSQGRTCRAFT